MEERKEGETIGPEEKAATNQDTEPRSLNGSPYDCSLENKLQSNAILHKLQDFCKKCSTKPQKINQQYYLLNL